MEQPAGNSILAGKLARRGVRLTRQRRILLDVIETAPSHIHASDLLRLVRDQNEQIDRATIYRTLSVLKKQGLIDELDLLHLDGSEHHYELNRGNNHVHIGCKVCGRIVEFETALLADLSTKILLHTGFEVESIRAEAAAICPECTSKAASK